MSQKQAKAIRDAAIAKGKNGTYVPPVIMTAAETEIYYNGTEEEGEAVMRQQHQTASYKARRMNHKIEVYTWAGELAAVVYPHTQI